MSEIFLLNPKNEVNDDVISGFIPMANVEDGFSGKHNFLSRKWGEIKKGYSHFKNGDIGIAKISPCFENLKSCIFVSLPNGVGAGTTELVILRGLCINVWFYLYLLKSAWYISQGTIYFKGVVGQQRVNSEIFKDLIVPLPPIDEQERIVKQIQRFFSLIDTIEDGKYDLNLLVNKAKNKILDLAIHGKLVPQDLADEPASELLKRVNPSAEITCDNEQYGKIPFEIPNSWLWLSHNEIIEISGGSQPAKSYFKETPENGYIRLYQIRDYGEHPVPVYIPIELASKTTQKGDILLARYGGSLGKVFIADEGAYNVAMAKVIFKVEHLLEKEYVYFYYLSKLYQDKLQTISRTAQAGFNSSDFEDMYFPLPPIDEQRRIVQRIKSLYSIIDNIKKSLEA